MAKEKVNPAWMFESDFDGVAYDYKRNRKRGEPSLEETIKEINEASSAEDREKALNRAMGVTNRRVKGLKKKEAAEGQMGDVVGAKTGGVVSSASKRADGIAIRGKTRA